MAAADATQWKASAAEVFASIILAPRAYATRNHYCSAKEPQTNMFSDILVDWSRGDDGFCPRPAA
jgi:hypothetical protein